MLSLMAGLHLIVLRDATCLTPEERKASEDNNKPRYQYQVKIWDGEGFSMWRQAKDPLRLLRIEEVRQVFRDGAWHDEKPQTHHIATTMPRAMLPPDTVWLIMHRRWDIETSLFNDLKQNWGYTQDPNGIRVLTALVAIARNLTLLLAYRRLRNFGSTRRTLTGLLRQVSNGILMGLGSGGSPLRRKGVRPAYLDSG